MLQEPWRRYTIPVCTLSWYRDEYVGEIPHTVIIFPGWKRGLSEL
jgi:hypothetical protein